MAEDFDAINAPQFFDFADLEEKDADTFFSYESEDTLLIGDPSNDPLQNSIDQQQINDTCRANNSSDANVDIHEDDSLHINLCTENGDFHQPEKDYYNNRQHFRRSMSVGDIFYLEAAIKNSHISQSTDSVTSSNTTGDNTKRTAPKKVKNKLNFQKKRLYGSDRNLVSSSYVPMAEAVRKFQVCTPDRFHTRAKSETAVITTNTARLVPTIPHSPHLISNKRHRPVNTLPHEEQELKEFEDAQKHKFKAHPVDKKIFLGPSKLPTNIEKKLPTVPEPFNVAKVKPKVAVTPPKREPAFHAKPAPDFSLKPQLKKPLQKFTRVETPTFLKRYQKTVEKPPAQPEPKKALPSQTKIMPLPISFEARNQFLLKRKETFVKNFIEEEKKAREFHARPVPKAVLNAPKVASNHSTKTVELRAKTVELKTKSISEENIRKEVRNRNSFEIKKKPLTEVQEFNLHTNLRARERQVFDKELKLKEELYEQLKRNAEMRRLQEEKEEVLRLRKTAEVKAHPIRKYKEMVIVRSGHITVPVSPKFHKNKNVTDDSDRLMDNKENSRD